MISININLNYNANFIFSCHWIGMRQNKTSSTLHWIKVLPNHARGLLSTLLRLIGFYCLEKAFSTNWASRFGDEFDRWLRIFWRYLPRHKYFHTWRRYYTISQISEWWFPCMYLILITMQISFLVVLKLECVKTKHPQLYMESKFYRIINLLVIRKCRYFENKYLVVKVHIFWEGHKILRNLHQLFDWQ